MIDGPRRIILRIARDHSRNRQGKGNDRARRQRPSVRRLTLAWRWRRTVSSEPYSSPVSHPCGTRETTAAGIPVQGIPAAGADHYRSKLSEFPGQAGGAPARL